jgi:hypothetical protein
MEEDYRRWKDLSCSCTGRINIVKMAIYQKQFTYSTQFPSNASDIHHRDSKINPTVM